MAALRKVSGILVLLFIVRAIIACSWCDCPVDTEQQFYEINDVSVMTLDNSGMQSAISSGPILKEAFGIRVDLETMVIANCTSGNGMFLYAFSCSCENASYISKDTIVSIRITSLHDFDDDHPAGSDISGFFQVLTEDYGWYSSLAEYIDNDRVQRSAEQTFNVFLTTPPATGGNYSFSVDINFKDGRTLTATTDEIILE